MSEAKFTPGPWVLQRRHNNVFRIISSCSIEWDIANVDNDVNIVRSGTDENGVSMETIANAKLIAAAPDLLGALKELLECDYTSGTHLYTTQIRARNAIEKATV